MDPLDTSEALARIFAGNIPDLTSKVQLVRDFPKFVTPVHSIWRGKLGDSTDVAIKLLRPGRTTGVQKNLLHAFVREAILWSRAMHHDNVVPLLGVARLDKSVAFVSPWMHGSQLARYLKVHQDAHVEQLFADVACGLAHLDTLGIVYGMLSSSTVLVSGTGRASLSSFLFARTQKGSEYDSNKKLQWRVTPRANDVVTFGTLITETLGNRSLSGQSHPRGHVTFNMNLGSDPVRPQSLPGLSDGLWDVVLSCWRKPEERPSMIEVAQRMVQLAKDSARTSNLNMISLNSSLPCLEDHRESPPMLADISTEVRRVGDHPIAGGGFGDLYLGERLGSEKVALKMVRFYGVSKQAQDAARRRFLSEAWLWAQFDHSRILKFYGVCKHGDLACFMVSPFLKNGNIVDYLADIKAADRRQLLLEAAEGLLYLHTRSEPVVHGDIKGANILITDTGSAVLTDFGLSKISHQATTTALQGAGSPRWMAPELVLATDKETGPLKSLKSDVYAFGHTMLEVYSNKIPFFDIKEDLHVLIKLLNGGRSPRPDGPISDKWLDDEAWEFCCRCTAIRLEERPDMTTVVSKLRPPRVHMD